MIEIGEIDDGEIELEERHTDGWISIYWNKYSNLWNEKEEKENDTNENDTNKTKEKVTGNRHIYASGSMYEGEFYNGKRHGHGKYVCDDGIFEGEFYNGYMHGHGKYTFVNGDVYEGEFYNGDRHGHGKYISIKGIYEGAFVNDYIEGRGTFTLFDDKQTVYSGEFRSEFDDDDTNSGEIVCFFIG